MDTKKPYAEPTLEKRDELVDVSQAPTPISGDS